MSSPRNTHVLAHPKLPPLPQSWSALTWEQLCICWDAKLRYGGNADVARVAAMIALYQLKMEKGQWTISTYTGEKLYRLRDVDGCLWTVTAREAAYLAKRSMPWFDWPYGDPGEKEQKDEKNNVIRERREPVNGYVSPMRDAMILPKDSLTIHKKHFALPQVACNNLTWQQYRSLQTIAPQLFHDATTDAEAVELQAQFLAHILTPRSYALLDASGGSVRVRPHYEYRYNAEQAEILSGWWLHRLNCPDAMNGRTGTAVLFHICFQTYQTALSYYALSYPLLFADSGKNDSLRDALTGEVGTVNTIMKYAGYAEQQQVYDSNLPFILDILNAMTKEAKEIEKMNAKIKKK